MRVFDSQRKAKWMLAKRTLEAPLKLGRGSCVQSKVSAETISKIKVIGRRVSGDGVIKLILKSKAGNILLSDSIKLPKGASSEIVKLCEVSCSNPSIIIERGALAHGSVIIDRVIVEGDRRGISAISSDPAPKVDYESLTASLARPVRVAVIIPYGIYGGGEVYLKNLIKQGRKGFVIDVLFMSNNKLIDELKDGNVNLVRLGGLAGLRSKVRPDKYDSIIFYNSKKVYEELVRKKDYEGLSASLIEIYHSDFQWPDALSRLKSRRHIAKMFRVAEGLAEDVSGILPEDKVCVPVSVDEERFSGKHSWPSDVSKSKRMAIGTVARLSPEKNIDYILSIAKEVPEHDFYILGSGPLGEKLLKRKTAESIDNVKFLGYKRNIENYYKVFDALLLTSKIEGTPISIAEALMSGLPIFTTPVGQIESLYSELSGVKMLSGELGKDAGVIRSFGYDDFDGTDNIRFARDMHGLKHNRELFFSNILSPLSLRLPDEGTSILRGEYL